MQQRKTFKKRVEKQLARYFKSGSNRVTLVIPHFPLVFKFPRPKLVYMTLRILYQMVCQMVRPRWNFSRKHILELYWRADLEEIVSGLLQSWSEFVFYLRTRHPLCRPTYFSLGFVSVCLACPTYPLDETDLWWQLKEITDRAAERDTHHFSNKGNFSLKGRRLLMRDYGSKITQNIILQYGHAIVTRFDPDYIAPWRKPSN